MTQSAYTAFSPALLLNQNNETTAITYKLSFLFLSLYVKLYSLSCLPSQEPCHCHPSGPGQSGEHPVLEDPHQHGAAGRQRLEAVRPRPATQRALWLTRLQEYHREATGM